MSASRLLRPAAVERTSLGAPPSPLRKGREPCGRLLLHGSRRPGPRLQPRAGRALERHRGPTGVDWGPPARGGPAPRNQVLFAMFSLDLVMLLEVLGAGEATCL